MSKIISQQAIQQKKYWVEEVLKLNENDTFKNKINRINKELTIEIDKNGITVLLDHLRLCGDIPELYSHDSSEEKLYSKYTDILLSRTYETMGMNSIVYTERSDIADVEAVAKNYSFVADAKAFRLSRTAKNQKDFKVQAMDTWKYGKPYAMVVCPIYQLPHRASQIYKQATTNNVCLFTYSHLSVLLLFAQSTHMSKSEELLEVIFKEVEALNPSKDAHDYWSAINKTMLKFSHRISKLWKVEKLAVNESIDVAKNFALYYLAQEREKVLRLNHKDALLELIRIKKLDYRENTIKSVQNNEILALGK